MKFLDEFKAVLDSATTTRLFLVCFIHIALCIFQIALAPGSKPLVLAGHPISPQLQWANTSFCLISLCCIIHAANGAIYFVESHLNLYSGLLAVSGLVDIAWIVMFTASGVESLGLAMALFFSLVFKVISAFMVSRAAKVVRNQYNAELLPHLKSALNKSFAGDTMPSQRRGHFTSAWPQSCFSLCPSFRPSTTSQVSQADVASTRRKLDLSSGRVRSSSRSLSPGPATSERTVPLMKTTEFVPGSQSLNIPRSIPTLMHNDDLPRSMPAEFGTGVDAVPSNLAPLRPLSTADLPQRSHPFD
eukprot:TRINITY_DN2178_c0_g1_i3.p1 TRINITY_DN2178_c0_g1~~TRINITY_DN2178_c0_g1_i3.p1  ORF type:complete len:302 (+),score=38.70 TRINITY_DN2178_c0_g1_i3:148-1053(+)